MGMVLNKAWTDILLSEGLLGEFYTNMYFELEDGRKVDDKIYFLNKFGNFGDMLARAFIWDNAVKRPEIWVKMFLRYYDVLPGYEDL